MYPVKQEYNYDLTAHNTFRMKVKCACYIEYDSAGDLEKIDFASLPQPVMHIGAGSNLLFTKDFSGTVLHSNIKGIKYVDMGLDELPIIVGAGVTFDDFVAQTTAHGLWGAENLSLIPGEVGAAAVQNIGAYGVEVKDIISGVVCYDTLERKSVKFKASECGYGYRESIFKSPELKGRYIITSVLFRLSRKPKPQITYKGLEGIDAGSPGSIRNAIIAIRKTKLPDPAETGSAGSFFKNPVVSAIDFARIAQGYDTVPHYLLPGGMVKVPAAWMIEQCGLKGATEGGAAVYEKQPLVLVNATGSAAPEDIVRLKDRIINTVRERFGVTLSPEAEII